MRKIAAAKFRTWLGIFLAPALMIPLAANAVPSFARQTGQNCVACHAGGQFPELTPYGRLFKLTGYTIGTRALPISAMAVASYNKTKNTTDVDPAIFPKNGNLIFSTASIFVAGKVTDNVGAFVQVTYNNYDAQSPSDSHWTGHSSSDNLDIRAIDRYINSSNDLIIGATMNNNPTVQDVWNSVPAWGYNTTPGSSGPATTPILAGGLAQNVAGIGGYAFWNKTLYAELAAYRTANGFWSFMSQGFNATRGDQQILKGANPYWRLALSHDWGAHSGMVGVLGLNAKIYPDPLSPVGSVNQYRDFGVDGQYQYILDPHAFTATASYIHERVTYADSVANQPHPLDPDGALGLPLTNASDTLRMIRAKASYVYHAKVGTTLSYFDVKGSSNAALQTSAIDATGRLIDGSEAIVGNLAGNPETRGWTTELFWTPVQYARIGLQYTMFNKFNGASHNYDGFGRNAKDNNTVFLYIWGAY